MNTFLSLSKYVEFQKNRHIILKAESIVTTQRRKALLNFVESN